MTTPGNSQEEARDFLNELAENPPKIPYEPDLLPTLFAATQETSLVSMQAIARLIERSQNLAARLLNIANSAYYVLEFKVTSLTRALSVLGLSEVRSLVLTVAMVSAIKGVRLPAGFDAQGLWLHQLRTAALSRAMAGALLAEAAPPKMGRETLEIQPDEVYVAGLLHDLGKVFLASRRPHLWESIEAIRQRDACSFSEAELSYWGMDHGIVASRVLHTWKVPLILTDAINWHHAPALAPSGRLDAGLLSAANILDHQGYRPGMELPEEISPLLPEGTDLGLLSSAVAERLKEGQNTELENLY